MSLDILQEYRKLEWGGEREGGRGRKRGGEREGARERKGKFTLFVVIISTIESHVSLVKGRVVLCLTKSSLPSLIARVKEYSQKMILSLW